MKYISIIFIVCLFSSFSHAKFKKKHYDANPGDVLVSLHGNIYSYNIDSDIRETNSETLLFGYGKMAYHLLNGFYVGGVYHRIHDDLNEKNTFGLNFTYVYKIFHVGATYLFHSNHKYRTDTINAELEKGSGFLLDASLNFPLSRNFYVGLGLTYHTLDYDEVDDETASTTNSNLNDKESFFMPMIQLSYFFGTKGKRIHESVNSDKSKKKRY